MENKIKIISRVNERDAVYLSFYEHLVYWISLFNKLTEENPLLLIAYEVNNLIVLGTSVILSALRKCTISTFQVYFLNLHTQIQIFIMLFMGLSLFSAYSIKLMV